MAMNDVVFVLTCAIRQNDGSYDRNIDSIWTSKDGAKAELARIKNNYNNEENQINGFRAKTPIGQPDDLSVDRLMGNFYECQTFYRILEKEVIS